MARILVRDLVPGTAYVAQVRAVNDNAKSEWSHLFGFITDADSIAPAAPTNLTFRFNGSSAMAAWGQPTTDSFGNPLKDFKNFQVKIYPTGSPASAAVYDLTTISFEFSYQMNNEFFNGTPQGALTIEVRARDTTGNLSDPATASATNGPPAAPTNVTGEVVADGIRVKWTASPDGDLKRYEIYSAATATGAGTLHGTVSPATTEYLHHTVAYTQDHYLYVKAVDEFNLSSVESTRTGPHRPKSPFTVDTTPPAATTLTTATPTRPTSEPAAVSLSWPAVSDSDLAGYHIRFSKNTTPRNWLYHDVIDKAATATTIEGLASATAYVFQIRSYDTMINPSAWSAEVTGTSSTSTLKEIATEVQIVAGGVLRSANFHETNQTGWRLMDSGLDILSGRVNARVVSAGTLLSSVNVTHDGTTQPAWSLNLAGNASLNDVQVRGKVVVGNSAGTTNGNVSIASHNFGGTGAQWAIRGDGTFDIKSGTGARVQLSSAGFFANNGSVDTVTINTSGGFTFRTGTNGVIFDGSGLRVVDGAGATKVSLNSDGSASFSGNITGSTGTFSGTLSSGSVISSTIQSNTIRSNNAPGGANSWQMDNTYVLRVWDGAGTQRVYIDYTGYAQFTNAYITGTIESSTIRGSTITGGTIQTSESWPRVIMDTSNSIKFYNSSGNIAGTVQAGSDVSSDSLGIVGRDGAYVTVYARNGYTYLGYPETFNYPSSSTYLRGAYVYIQGAYGRIQIENTPYINNAGRYVSVEGHSHTGSEVYGMLNAHEIKSYTSGNRNNNVAMDWDGTYFRLYANGNSIARFRSGSTMEGATITGTAGSSKAFVIQHPLEKDKYLQHACIEGPTADVYYRGEGETVDGIATINLPDYFESLTHLDNRTVTLTLIDDGSDDFALIKAGRVTDGKFDVRSSIDTKFYWEVKAERSDIPRQNSEPKKRDYRLYGTGPYTYLIKR